MRAIIRLVCAIAACSVLLSSHASAQNAIVQQRPGTMKYFISTGSSQDETQIKATTGVLLSASGRNSSASVDAYLKCTNLTAASTTPGTSTIYYEMIIPHGSGFVDSQINTAFTVALTCYLVTGQSASSTANVAANEVSVNIRYR